MLKKTLSKPAHRLQYTSIKNITSHKYWTNEPNQLALTTLWVFSNSIKILKPDSILTNQKVLVWGNFGLEVI